MTPERLFVDLWKEGVHLTIEDNRLHFQTDSTPPPHLIQTLRTHKDVLMLFLTHWIDLPGIGHVKLWGLLPDGRAGVVLRRQPDRVTWISKQEIDNARTHGDKPDPKRK